MAELLSQAELIRKITKLKTDGTIDLSMEEDLSLAIMNLVSLEEHFFFTAAKTGQDEYYDLLRQTREIRKSLLAKMINQHEGETWCISKHLLAATMRLIEVGTKLQSSDAIAAKDMFSKAYELYSLFWALRLKLINITGLKKINDQQINKHDASSRDAPWSKADIVRQLVDCCDE